MPERFIPNTSQTATAALLAEDRTSTMLAMTHHIQTRIIQAANKGGMSRGTADEVRRMAEQIAEAAYRLAREG